MKIGWKLSTLIIIIIVIMNIRFGNSECLATSVKQSTLIESFEAFEKIIVSTSTKNLLTTEKILTTENIAYVSLHNFSKFEFFLENYYPDLCFVIVFLKCQNFHECWAYSQKARKQFILSKVLYLLYSSNLNIFILNNYRLATLKAEDFLR